MEHRHISIPIAIGTNQHIKLDGFSLRVPKPEDAPAMNALILKNQTRLAEYMPWANGHPTEADALEFIMLHKDDIRLNRPPVLLIWVEEKLCGAIGFHDHNYLDRKVALGYWIDSDYEGRGIITRGCIAMIDHVFDSLKLNRVSILCAEQNVRSRAVPERLGFTKEGVEADGQWVHNRYMNMVHYRMLKREWQLVRQ